MNSYRITKYNPDLRDADGAYLVKEWTCVADIGKKFLAGEFKAEDYLAIEVRYINALMYIWELAKGPALSIVSLELNSFVQNRSLNRLPEVLRDVAADGIPGENQSFSDPGEIRRVVSLILREIIWGKLESATGLRFHFGWDYYMYCVGIELYQAEKEKIEAEGLFVEEFSSPYLEHA